MDNRNGKATPAMNENAVSIPATKDSPEPEAALRLLSWYDENRRILPWREDPAPYHVWLSEIMLQQTRVETVREYYARFLARLPDIEALAAAEEDVYLKLWEGLGYYSRVRNLHRAAVQIVEELGGKMPESSDQLQRLSGIGPYTAAAIASICFGERIPAIDGNLLRIFARMTGYEESIKTDRAKKAAREYYLAAFSRTRPGDQNQALMDLGAVVCLPRGNPLCERCPWAEDCIAHRRHEEDRYPVPEKAKARPVEKKTVFLVYYDQRLALRKREERGLLAGLYEFPNAEGHLDRSGAAAHLRSLGFDALRIRRLEPARHVFSHREWDMIGYQILADEWVAFAEGEPKEHELFLADARQLKEVYSIPSAFAAYQKAIRFDYLRGGANEY